MRNLAPVTANRSNRINRAADFMRTSSRPTLPIGCRRSVASYTKNGECGPGGPVMIVAQRPHLRQEIVRFLKLAQIESGGGVGIQTERERRTLATAEKHRPTE